MGEPSKPFKIGSIIWSVAIAIAVIVLGASIMLPSTKRARFDFTERQRRLDQESSAAAATEPATQPAATQP